VGRSGGCREIFGGLQLACAGSVGRPS
jgi:hypothetical protein